MDFSSESWRAAAVFHCRSKHFDVLDFAPTEEEAHRMYDAFWRGYFMVVEKADIEDEEFWVENSIALAISLDSGFIKDDEAEGEVWYHYLFGRKALNIPVRSPPLLMVQRARFSLPYMAGVLAAGKNIALHSSDVQHEGVFGLMIIGLALSPPRADADADVHALHVAHAIHRKWYEGAELPREQVEACCSQRHAEVFLRASKQRLWFLMSGSTVPS